jgi:hypothetical protein
MTPAEKKALTERDICTKFITPALVAKVDELMRWCDALEARLADAQTNATRLLDATLHQLITTET